MSRVELLRVVRQVVMAVGCGKVEDSEERINRGDGDYIFPRLL